VTAQGGAGCIGITLVAVKPNISTTCTSVYAPVSMASLFLTTSPPCGSPASRYF
jgi:hypothetical protein